MQVTPSTIETWQVLGNLIKIMNQCNVDLVCNEMFSSHFNYTDHWDSDLLNSDLLKDHTLIKGLGDR